MGGFESYDGGNADEVLIDDIKPLNLVDLNRPSERVVAPVEQSLDAPLHLANSGAVRQLVPINDGLAHTSCQAYANQHRHRGGSIPWDMSNNGGCFGNGEPIYRPGNPVIGQPVIGQPVIGQPVIGDPTANQQWTIVLSESSGGATYDHRQPYYHRGGNVLGYPQDRSGMVIHSTGGSVPNIEQESRRVTIDGIGEISSNRTEIGTAANGRPIYATRGSDGQWTADHSLMVGGMILEGLRISKGVSGIGDIFGGDRRYQNDPRRRYHHGGYNAHYGGFTSNRAKRFAQQQSSDMVLSGTGPMPDIDKRNNRVHIDGIGSIEESSTRVGRQGTIHGQPGRQREVRRNPNQIDPDRALMWGKIGLEAFRIIKD